MGIITFTAQSQVLESRSEAELYSADALGSCVVGEESSWKGTYQTSCSSVRLCVSVHPRACVWDSSSRAANDIQACHPLPQPPLPPSLESGMLVINININMNAAVRNMRREINSVSGVRAPGSPSERDAAGLKGRASNGADAVIDVGPPPP